VTVAELREVLTLASAKPTATAVWAKRPWTDPAGLAWDMSLHYKDVDGDVWCQVGRADGVPVMKAMRADVRLTLPTLVRHFGPITPITPLGPVEIPDEGR
jgi:hypothetical protein